MLLISAKMVKIGPLLTKLWYQQVSNPKMVPNWLANLGIKTCTTNDVWFSVYVHISRVAQVHDMKRTGMKWSSDATTLPWLYIGPERPNWNKTGTNQQPELMPIDWY